MADGRKKRNLMFKIKYGFKVQEIRINILYETINALNFHIISNLCDMLIYHKFNYIDTCAILMNNVNSRARIFATIYTKKIKNEL